MDKSNTPQLPQKLIMGSNPGFQLPKITAISSNSPQGQQILQLTRVSQNQLPAFLRNQRTVQPVKLLVVNPGTNNLGQLKQEGGLNVNNPAPANIRMVLNTPTSQATSSSRTSKVKRIFTQAANDEVIEIIDDDDDDPLEIVTPDTSNKEIPPSKPGSATSYVKIKKIETFYQKQTRVVPQTTAVPQQTGENNVENQLNILGTTALPQIIVGKSQKLGENNSQIQPKILRIKTVSMLDRKTIPNPIRELEPVAASSKTSVVPNRLEPLPTLVKAPSQIRIVPKAEVVRYSEPLPTVVPPASRNSPVPIAELATYSKKNPLQVLGDGFINKSLFSPADGETRNTNAPRYPINLNHAEFDPTIDFDTGPCTNPQCLRNVDPKNSNIDEPILENPDLIFLKHLFRIPEPKVKDLETIKLLAEKIDEEGGVVMLPFQNSKREDHSYFAVKKERKIISVRSINEEHLEDAKSAPKVFSVLRTRIERNMEHIRQSEIILDGLKAKKENLQNQAVALKKEKLLLEQKRNIILKRKGKLDEVEDPVVNKKRKGKLSGQIENEDVENDPSSNETADIPDKTPEDHAYHEALINEEANEDDFDAETIVITAENEQTDTEQNTIEEDHEGIDVQQNLSEDEDQNMDLLYESVKAIEALAKEMDSFRGNEETH